MKKIEKKSKNEKCKTNFQFPTSFQNLSFHHHNVKLMSISLIFLYTNIKHVAHGRKDSYESETFDFR